MSKIASKTFPRIKSIPTSIVTTITQRMMRVDFIRKNKTVVIIVLIIWVMGNAGAYPLFRSANRWHKEKVFQTGIAMTQKLAADINVPLMENDVLRLNTTIRSFENLPDFSQIAIVDHQSIIMAHTHQKFLNQPYQVLINKKHIGGSDATTMISSGICPDGETVIQFSKDITYSSIKIGTVHFSFSGQTLAESKKRHLTYYVGGMLCFTLFLALFLFVFNYAAKAKVTKLQKEFDGMKRIGPYVLLKKIAQGGMAELYLSDYVREDGFRRKVVVKLILPHLLQYPEFALMFIREARLAAMLQHPNIVQIIDFRKIGDASFLAMEYVHGINLSVLLARVKESLPIDMCIYIVLNVLSGLQYSHTKRDDTTGAPLSVVHRDISPQNLLISFQGEIKISDFGISKAMSEPSITQGGSIKGKLTYIAPEQALGEPVNHQADIYSLGVVFYEMLAGRKPYRFENDIQAIRQLPDITIPPLKSLRADIPDELEKIVMKSLEKDLEKRYQSALEFSDRLLAYKNENRVPYGKTNFISFLNEHFGKTYDTSFEASNEMGVDKPEDSQHTKKINYRKK